MLDNAYEIMRELEKLGNENIKNIYKSWSKGTFIWCYN